MATNRLTILFHHQSSDTSSPSAPPVRVAGWSESFYYNDSITDSGDIARLCQRRAALLPQNAFIIGQRYQFADGSSRSDSVRYNSNTGLAVDVPQMSLLCSARNLAQQSTRRFMIRGIPDAWVVNGELVGGSAGVAARARINAYFDELADWLWKARDRNAATADIMTIAANGQFNLAQDLAFADGDLLRFQRVVSTVKLPIKGSYRVLSHTSQRVGVFANWNGLTVSNVGKVQLVAFKFVPFVIKAQSFSRVAVKKVGRSFFQYRGRASKRKAI